MSRYLVRNVRYKRKNGKKYRVGKYTEVYAKSAKHAAVKFGRKKRR